MGIGIVVAAARGGFLGAGVLERVSYWNEISTEDFPLDGYFSLAIIWAGNVELASSRGFSTDDTHIQDEVCRIADGWKLNARAEAEKI